MIDFQMVIHTYGKTMEDSVRQYITDRYQRWLDYSRFHCSQANIQDEAVELLNECLLSLLEKDASFLEFLFNQKKGQYREIDFYVLRSIKTNAYSMLAPYRYKNRPIPTAEVNLESLKIIDESDNEPDKPAQILKEMRLITWVLKGLDLTVSERRVFESKFLHGNSLCGDWNGPETRKQCY